MLAFLIFNSVLPWSNSELSILFVSLYLEFSIFISHASALLGSHRSPQSASVVVMLRWCGAVVCLGGGRALRQVWWRALELIHTTSTWTHFKVHPLKHTHFAMASTENTHLPSLHITEKLEALPLQRWETPVGTWETKINKMEFVGSDGDECLFDCHQETLGGPGKKFASSLVSQWRKDRHEQVPGSRAQLRPNQDKGWAQIQIVLTRVWLPMVDISQDLMVARAFCNLGWRSSGDCSALCWWNKPFSEVRVQKAFSESVDTGLEK